MNDAPLRIFLLCDADECAFNESLQEARNKLTITELEREYQSWRNLINNTRELSLHRLVNELPRTESSLTQFRRGQDCLIAYVTGDEMYFLPPNLHLS